MELKTALGKMKSSRGTALHFFLCDGGADGKPVLVLDSKRVPPKETQAILDTAKKKTKSAGRMEINADGELLVTPIGSASSSLAKNIQIAARNANAMVFNGIVINPEEAEGESEEVEKQTEQDAPMPVGKAKAPPVAPKAPSHHGAEFTARLKTLGPSYLKAVQAHGPTTEELKNLFNQVHAELKEKQFDQVGQTLDQLEKRVNEALEASPTDAQPKAKGKFVDFQVQRLLYDNARKSAHAELKKLQASILETCAKDPRLPDIKKAITQFDDAMSQLDDQLLHKLDDGLSEVTPEKKQTLQKEAAVITRKYLAHVQNNTILAGVDDNPFLPVQVHKTLVTALTVVATRLEG